MDEPVHLQALITSGAWLDAGREMSLTSENLEISNVLFEVDKSHEILVYFTAVTHEDEHITRSVNLTIDGYSTSLTIEGVAPASSVGRVEKIFNFPKPMRQGTEFVFEATSTATKGQIRIFSTSGHQVASLDITEANFKIRNQWCVPWDGLDGQGDRLGNGTYLYRVELDVPTGRLNSSMQRLVMMR